MDVTQVESDIKHFILTEFLPGEDENDLTLDLELISTGILDSISVIGVVAHIQTNYQIDIGAHEASLENMNTIQSIATLVISKLSQ